MLTRRNWLVASAALSALALVGGCEAEGLPALAPLKSLAPYPLGVAATVSEIHKPDWAELAAAEHPPHPGMGDEDGICAAAGRVFAL